MTEKMVRGIKEKIGSQTENLENPEIGNVYIADPRNFKVSEFNIRVTKPLYGIKKLEDSILEMGFTGDPLVANFKLDPSDGKYSIIDGGRRWGISMKHGFKIPVVFKDFKDEIEQILFSILANSHEPVEAEDLGRAALMLEERGLSLDEISVYLGSKEVDVQGWINTTSYPKEIEESPEARERFESVPREVSKDILELAKARGIKEPLEQVKLLNEFEEIPEKERKRIVTEAKSGRAIDISKRLTLLKESEIEIKTYTFSRKTLRPFLEKIRRLGWDETITLDRLMKKFTRVDGLITQEEYDEE